MSSHSAPSLLSSAANLDSSSPSPSLYVTFWVLSVVSALQKRFMRRGNARPTKRVKVRAKTRARRPPSQDLETQAYAEIDKYLGRKTIYPSGRRSRKGQRVSDSISLIDTKEQIHRLLSKLDSQVHLISGHALSSIADQDTFFLGRRAHFHIKTLTLSALIELLMNVKNLLHLVQQPDHSFDDSYLANLVHLLLCLHHQLLRLLIKKCIALIRRDDCQRDRKRRDWFSVFPDSKTPNCTTGPYVLRPSLAVLWGVCWKFKAGFDAAGNLVDNNGNIEVPASIVEVYTRQLRQRQQTSYHPGVLASSESTSRQSQRQQHQQQHASPSSAEVQMLLLGVPGPDPMAQPRSWQDHDGQTHLFPEVARPQAATASTPSTARYPRLRPSSAPDPAIQSLGQSTSGAAPPDPRPTGQYSAYPQPNTNPWESFSVAESQPSPSPLNVYPRFDISYGEGVQNNAYSGSSASSAHEDNIYGAYSYSYQQRHQMAQVQAPQAAMHTLHEDPYTDPALVAPNGLKRSHSQMSHNDAQVQYEIPIPYPPPPPHMLQQEERAGSVVSNHDEQSDDSPHHGSRSFKRGNPPQNANLKYYCDFSSECDGMTFDRKCEWSKHMDKHDRPYRCPHSQCGKLQGFTYSGGLLRHEREVHGKHGGPKAALSCPYEECKRHTGKGFTRKENLNEHIRRVHNDKTPAPLQEQDIEAAEAAAAAFKAGLQEAIAGAAQRPMPAKLPYPEPVPEQQYIPEPAEMVKRRRLEEEPVLTEPEDTPQNEIERLMVENAQQAARIREMETQEARRELRISQLEDMLTQVHSPQQTTHITIDDKILAVAQQT
ncbi:hypothetical protein LTR27_006006 [Elasticomyces elasticus]|nr:hypothetical protein LTR27_006006 [Elasticomyces elasticus]